VFKVKECLCIADTEIMRARTLFRDFCLVFSLGFGFLKIESLLGFFVVFFNLRTSMYVSCSIMCVRMYGVLLFFHCSGLLFFPLSFIVLMLKKVEVFLFFL